MLKSKVFKALISCFLVLSLAASAMIPAFAAPEDEEGYVSTSAAAEEMLDDWFDVFLAERTTEDGSVKGLTSWRWSDKWQQRQMDVDSGEPRETDFWLSGIVFESFNDYLEYGDQNNTEYREKIMEIMDGLYVGFAESEWHPNWDVHIWEDNTYNDDLCWWSMAMLRAHQLTGEEKYFNLSKQMLDKLLTDFDTTEGFGGEPYGGILWRRSEVVAPTRNASKDACANGNAGLLSYRFAQYYAEQGLKAKAKHYADYGDKIYEWTMAHLYKGDGYVINSINYSGRENAAQFTYNYGVIAGSAYERYLYYGNQEDLDRATEIMDSAFQRFNQEDGLTIKTEGTGDSAGFKTIMLRIAAQMYKNGDAPQYEVYLKNNALQAWTNRRDSDGLIGDNIAVKPADDDAEAGIRLCSPCAILGPSLLLWADFDPETDVPQPDVPEDPEVGYHYEAEDAIIDGCAVTNEQVSGYLGTGHIQYWDQSADNRNDGSVEFKVNVEEAGTYMMFVRWYTRGNNTRRLSVNGSESERISFTRTASNTWESQMILVDLNEGINSILFSYKNARVHADADSDPWFFLDCIDLKTVDASTDKNEYKVGEEVKFTINTDAEVTRVGAADANGKFLGKETQDVVENEDGSLTWTFTSIFTAPGEKAVSVYMDNGNGVLFDTGKKLSFVIVEDKPEVSGDAVLTSATLDKEVALKNEAITATIVTSTGVGKVGIFNESGKALGKISESYEDADGVRTWTVTFAIGSRGTRELGIKVADGNGAWSEATPVTVIVK